MLVTIIAICCTTTVTMVLMGCKETNNQEDNPASTVTSEELIRTSQSWDGAEQPEYLQGRPEPMAVHYEIPPGKKLDWHLHIGRWQTLIARNMGLAYLDKKRFSTVLLPIGYYFSYSFSESIPLDSPISRTVPQQKAWSRSDMVFFIMA